MRSTRSRSSTRSRCRRSWRASGRTSRPAVTAPTSPSISPAPSSSGSRSPTAPTSTRSIPTPMTAGTTSWSCSSPTRRRSPTRRHAGGRSRHLPVGDGSQRRRNAAARPDPAPADVPVGAVGVRGAAADPRAVRQRRRPVAHGQHDARRPLPRFRAVILEVPDTGHEGAVLVPRLGRHPERQSSHAAGHQLIHVQRQGAPADRLFREHGHGRPVGKRVGVAVELEAEPGRHCGVLSVGRRSRRTRP